MKNIEDMFRVGVISNTHGIRGEVKVFPTTDDVRRFSKRKTVYLVPLQKGMRGIQKNDVTELTVAGVKYFKQYAIVRFKEIDDINDVEKYKGMEMYIDREDAIPLEEGEYYIADLIGLTVMADDKKHGEEDYRVIGVLKDVMQTGANDVYVVEGNEELRHKEILIPAIRQCIIEVNLKEKIMKVHLLEGLLGL